MPDLPPLNRLLLGPPGKTCYLPTAIGDKCSARSDPDLGPLSVVVLLSVVSRILPFRIVDPIPDHSLVLGFPILPVNLPLVLRARVVLVVSIVLSFFCDCILFFAVVCAGISLWFFFLSDSLGGCWTGDRSPQGCPQSCPCSPGSSPYRHCRSSLKWLCPFFL